MRRHADLRTPPIKPEPRQCVVVGSGTVGLALSARLHALGHTVHLRDRDETRLMALRSGACPWISDPQLREQVARTSWAWSLGLPGEAGPEHTDLLAICVQTQPAREPLSTQTATGGLPNPEVITALTDHAHLWAQAKEAGLIALRSTGRPGTARAAAALTGRAVVAWPEFLRADHAWADTNTPARSVMGGHPTHCSALRGLTADSGVAYDLTWEEAELAKLGANALLSLQLAGLHWLRDLGTQLLGGSDGSWLRAAAHDPRLGADVHGPAWIARDHWGGHCLPKDLQVLAQVAGAAGADPALLEAALRAQQDTLQRSRRPAAPGHAEGEV